MAENIKLSITLFDFATRKLIARNWSDDKNETDFTVFLLKKVGVKTI